MIKVVSSGHNAHSILRDAECFAFLLRFYDGICQWEEGSATPVLHIGWAKALVNTISKFDADVRAQVIIICKDFDEEIKQKAELENSNNKYVNNNNNYCTTTEDKGNLHPSIEALTAACGEKLLNPEYLLQGGGQPFVGTSDSGSGEKAGTSKEPAEVKEVVEDKVICTNPTIVLYSQKMKGLKGLLLAEKLNTQAISLQLTAQSQVQIGKKVRSDMDSVGLRPKRTRRE